MRADPRAHAAVYRAVAEGRLPDVRTLPCADCGAPARDYHHDQGYAPAARLAVVALCPGCHRRRHPLPPGRARAGRTLTVRLPEAVLAALREVADEERRSLTSTLVIAAEEYLRRKRPQLAQAERAS